ncbi:class I SAM-dependent methyltransferase [Actinomadura kijaniata]|uniref:class I SAM-dependent methyltransferase n=1 Tax=Actinomadura kijaniata TaxID=46161 RepID=UPI000832EFFA|nr:class I SAM-dependent methyltransferase [Actinomadura kijaniata]
MTDATFWDERYADREQLFSGLPNGVLVAEAAGLPPGQALDVGCGEGGDAFWLAGRGWRVTAIDISRVALERAVARAGSAFPNVAWARADLTVTPPPAGSFDLVSIQYFPLPRRAGHAALRALLSAVAPGGTLLVVGHDRTEIPDGEHGFHADDYYEPTDYAALLDDTWTVLVDETRPRAVPPPPGTHHTRDVVLRARRAAVTAR